MTKSWDKGSPLKELIERALKAKIEAGLGSFYDKGQRKKKVSRRQKTRDLWANNPDLKPWPLRPRLFGRHTISRKGK